LLLGQRPVLFVNVFVFHIFVPYVHDNATAEMINLLTSMLMYMKIYLFATADCTL